MSDRVQPIQFAKLMNILLNEYNREQTVFGVEKLFRKNTGDAKLQIFRENLELPFGIASGSHTQYAQNIVAAYAAGSRYMELKTVQTVDGTAIRIAKPCINALDECYNVTSSTELTVEDAMNEYIKAWFAIKLIAKEFQLGDEDGVIFNMSLGYNLESIKSDKLNKFIDGLKNARGTAIWTECRDYALDNLKNFKKVNAQYIAGLSDAVCKTATISLHNNCKASELEEMAKYLLTEKKLNVYIKIAPTVIGYEVAKKILKNLGYEYINFDDKYFLEDLQLNDAIPMFKKLLELAQSSKLGFGVKISNTLKVNTMSKDVVGEEMYLSGRSLYPLAISAAKLFTNAFDGKLHISYCGGVDAYNAHTLAKAGLWPVTLTSNILKPGGYARINQIATLLSDTSEYTDDDISPSTIEGLANSALTDPHYGKSKKAIIDRRLSEKLPLTDCFKAACKTACPIRQDIPAYIRLSSEGKNVEALKLIMEKNPLPSVISVICNHSCTNKCTRNYYDRAVSTRQIERDIVEKAYDEVISTITPPPITVSGKKVAIVGGGPAGMSAAYFLAKAGVRVTIYEKSDRLGGMISQLMPEFRVPRKEIENDIDFLRRMGIGIELDTEVEEIDTLKYMGYTHIVLAMGAWVENKPQLISGTPMNVIDFLKISKNSPEDLKLGDNVTIMAGGNTAITAARVAKRIAGVKAVRIICPTSRKFMFGDEGEIELAEKEGIEIWELLQPINMKWRALECKRMSISSIDVSGNPNLIDSGAIVSITSDTIISAIGEKIDDKFYRRNNIATDEKGNPYLSKETLESMTLKGVYIIGDGNHGAATVAEAIADAQKAAAAILGKDRNMFDTYENLNVNSNYAVVKSKKGIVYFDDTLIRENEKCLDCQTVCEACVDVCPNRANISIAVPTMQSKQIIHIDALCNSCGNCETFCVYNDAPSKSKLTFYNLEADYRDGNINAFMVMDKNIMSCKIRIGGASKDCIVNAPVAGLDEDIRNIIVSFIKRYSYLI